jgi:flavorubredoxin
MFTYLKSDGVVFTCDFLGAHYCEPQMIDSKVNYLDAYLQSVQEYYDAIFGPFPKYVRQGLDILSKLEFKYVCNSHGPILTKGVEYETIYHMYETNSRPVTKPFSIPIFCASAYGYSMRAALTIQATIKATDQSIVTEIYDVNNYSRNELAQLLNQADAFCLGGPTINKNAVPPILDLLSSLDTINSENKPILIFGSYG